MIDIVIPTMWMSTELESALKTYVQCQHVNSIIIVDNARQSRPSWDTLEHQKIQLISYGRNIYVNPAWNEGCQRSTAKILAIINDDIQVSSDVFNMVISFGLRPGDLVGVNLRGRQDNYRIDDVIDTQEEIVELNYDPLSPIGGQAWAFGICMFMLRESYHMIPSLYQVWYGDDYLAQHATRVYAINSDRIKGKISETLKKFNDPNSDVSKRIELDSKNLIRFDHFKNAKNWDIPHNMIEMYQQQRKELVQQKNIFETEYQRARQTASDINQNVHILYELAKQCNTVVEMGVRTGVSTRAFLNTDAALLSFDVTLDPTVQQLFDTAQSQGKNVQYIRANVLDIDIDPCDLLFIDTLHTYQQLSQELALHGNRAQKFLVFHDTHTFGLQGEDGRDRQGLLSAIIEFLISNPHWRFSIYKTNNNGLTVLERT
jgi:hypothetical protein